MSKSWGEWEAIHASESYDTAVNEGDIVVLPPRCLMCGYEFSHPAWDPKTGSKCPRCGATTKAAR